MNYPIMTGLVKVGNGGMCVLLPAVEVEGTNTLVSMVPDNSIFTEGYVQVQYGDHFFVVKGLRLDDYKREIVTEKKYVGGRRVTKKYFMVKGIDNTLLRMLRFGKNAHPDDVLKLIEGRATKKIVDTVIAPKVRGVGIWTPWASTQHLSFDEVGMGVHLARRYWVTAVKEMKREGYSVSDELVQAVLNNPALLNGVTLYINRHPVHDEDCLNEVVLVVTNSPMATVQVTPEKMKAMLGDNDGDGSDTFTFERKGTLADMLTTVSSNFAGNENLQVRKIYGIDYHEGNTRATKKGVTVDVNLLSVVHKPVENLWEEFMGFKTKRVIGQLVTQFWGYSWAIARLLDDNQLEDLIKEAISREPGRRAESMGRLYVSWKSATKPEKQALLRAEICSKILYRMFGIVAEHVFDARKGVKLEYDPIELLSALTRTGRFDWEGMEAEGVWVTPLKLVSKYLWSTHTYEGSTKEYYRYSLSDTIMAHDEVYYHLVAARGKGWVNGNTAVRKLSRLIHNEGVTPLIQSLYLQGHHISLPVISVPEDRMMPEKSGETVDMLEGLKARSIKINTGPSTFTELIKLCREFGVNISIQKESDGSLYLCHPNTSRMEYLGNFTIEDNVEGFGESGSPYLGHILKSETSIRAFPPVLTHSQTNSVFGVDPDLVKASRSKRRTPFPGLNNDWQVLSFYGVVAWIIIDAFQRALTEEQALRWAALAIRRRINKAEVIKNPAASAVFRDMIITDICVRGLNEDYVSAIEDLYASILFRAGFSLLAVSKDDPMDRFIFTGRKGVPLLVEEYDPFWPIRTARRTDREAVSTFRNLLELHNPKPLRVKWSRSGVLDKYRQSVVMAFFNTTALKGGHDPIEFTPEGMEKARVSAIKWEWLSSDEVTDFLDSLTPEEKQKCFELREIREQRGLAMAKSVMLDEELSHTVYATPTYWEDSRYHASTFKVHLPGTKSMVQPCNVSLVASHTPIKDYADMKRRLGKYTKSGVWYIDGVMPAETIQAKGAWSLIACACASQLSNEYTVTATTPEEVLENVKEISTQLKKEGKSGDGKMFIYRVDGESITPLMDGDNQLKAVVGEVPMYRPDFYTSFGPSMSKLKTKTKLGFSERTLVGEVPIITDEEEADLVRYVDDAARVKLSMGILPDEEELQEELF